MTFLFGAVLSGTAGLIVVIVLVALAVVTLATAIGLLITNKPKPVEHRLEPYMAEPQAGGLHAQPTTSFAETRLIQSAIDATERVAGRTGLLTRVDTLLEQAEVPMRPAEVLFFYAAFLLVVAIACFFALPEPIAGLIVLVVIAAIPYAILRRKAESRRGRFEEQLPETLSLLAGSMRAGFSFLQGLEAVIEESEDPIRKELQLAFNEARLGRDIEDSLEEAADRMGSKDFHWTVMALRIQREVGGNLAELLDTVSQTMRQREQLRREVRALTAEGRLSGLVLGFFPAAMAALLYVLQPSYITTLFKSTGGIIAVVFATGLACAGFVWLRKIVQIEV